MKRNNINRIFKLGLFSLALAAIDWSCVKSREGRTDFENLTPTVLISEGGLQNFGIDAILFPPTDDVDTTFFHMNYAATDVAPSDQVVTIAIDDAAIDAYNAANGTDYAKFPDSIYSFTTTSVTIPKGANYSSGVPLIMFPSKINLLKDYMLPISITVAPAGTTISANHKTIYYHLIGNPIAGIYNWDWYRWNNTTPTGPNTGGTPALGGSAVLAPITGTQVEVASGYFIGPRYEITFTDSSGVLIDFAATFNSDDLATMKDVYGVTITSGPTFDSVNVAAGYYQIHYTAATPDPRYVIDKFYK
jgi:hypothetical protein